MISPDAFVALVFSVVFAPKVIAPKVIAPLVELIVPFKVVADGLDAVIPPAYDCVPPLSPNARLPVLLNVTALVIVVSVAFNARL